MVTGEAVDDLGVLPWVHLAIDRQQPFRVVKEQWNREPRTSVRFADNPWSSFDELETALANIDGVSSLRYEDPYEGPYRSPRYHLIADKRADINAITKAIKGYYDGLTVQTNGRRVTVIISATK